MTLANSVVQTGVKSAGCEKRIAHDPPNQLWNEIGPCVVSALKSGNSVPKAGISAVLANSVLARRYLVFLGQNYCDFGPNLGCIGI